jgi:hypothetical protein
LAVKQPRLLAELSRDAIAGRWHHGPVDSASAGQSYQLSTASYCHREGSRSSAGQRTTIASIGQSSILDKDRARRLAISGVSVRRMLNVAELLQLRE